MIVLTKMLSPAKEKYAGFPFSVELYHTNLLARFDVLVNCSECTEFNLEKYIFAKSVKRSHTNVDL